MEQALAELDKRILDLEWKRIKKMADEARCKPTPQRSIPKPITRQSILPADWEVSMSTMAGRRTYRLRRGNAWTTLPENRALWPTDVREIEDKFDEADKARRRGGRIVSIGDDSVQFV